MELVKNIFFNTDKLIENSVVKLSYTGKLFQENSEEVFIHYGFGDNWDNVTEFPMTKTELGFQVEFQLTNKDKLNLCFRNSKDEWDNNDYKNYTFQIEEAPVSLAIVENNSLETPRKLRKTYLWSKKIKLAVYKIIKYFPKLISVNYRRKVENINHE